MASLNMGLGLAATKSRVFVTKASKSGRRSVKEEKGPFDWIMAGMQKEDQLLETDPVLQKVEGDKSPSKTTGSVSITNKKKKFGGFGGLGGLFAKN